LISVRGVPTQNIIHIKRFRTIKLILAPKPHETGDFEGSIKIDKLEILFG